VILTDEHRLAVVAELFKFMRDRRYYHMDNAAYAYEREVKERIAAASQKAAGR
jgi:hypothetical protein